MLSVSIFDKDLQPVRAHCQKRLTFTSKFLGLICIHEPQDWLASSVGPRTNRLWHHLHSTQLRATFYFVHVCVSVCVCVAVCVCGAVCVRERWFCCGLASVFCCVIYHVKKSEHHRADNWAACVITVLVLTNRLSFFVASFYQFF